MALCSQRALSASAWLLLIQRQLHRMVDVKASEPLEQQYVLEADFVKALQVLMVLSGRHLMNPVARMLTVSTTRATFLRD